MDTYKETSETWNKLAKLYEEKFMDLDLYNLSYDNFCKALSKEKARVVDMGCGPGNASKYLLYRRPDLFILGIDNSPNMLALAKENNPKVSFELLDIRQIEKLKTSFDGILCGFCLPYLTPTDAMKFISDAYQLLNKNGVLYISFVEGEPSKSGFQVSKSGDRIYFNYYLLSDLITQLEGNKFGQIELSKVSYPKSENETEIHTILIARKLT
ncbi:MAG: class I SAM-dependent methyltransferase [Bacteroidia bacterium]|nr:class I SAM-dependent methyltransferase [Bacteroidia bacterium]MCF8446089.1 class I SAM-dependent methyltransferase [Bacteroidia bacterium]